MTARSVAGYAFNRARRSRDLRGLKHRMVRRPGLAVLAALLAGAGCDPGDKVSTADVQAAAKERVRQSLGLQEGSALFTNMFVGKPVNGDMVLCGTVGGRRADGSTITPPRFIAATDPARWIKFEPATGIDIPLRPDMFIEWHTTCAGEEEVR